MKDYLIKGDMIKMTMQMVLIYLVIMVVLFLPQILSGRKKRKQQEDMMNSLKSGSKVVTIGGIHGTVVSIGETTVDINIDKNINMTISKNAISGVRD